MGEYILHYPPIKNLMPPASFHHSEISELYYVTRGEGTALLGGELENPAWRPENTVSFKQVSGPGVAGPSRTIKRKSGDRATSLSFLREFRTPAASKSP